MKEKFKFVFVLLTYRNYTDLSTFLINLKLSILKEYKVIVVNSFYDNETMNQIEAISINENCDFLNIDNKGYGYGNNYGINFAKENYLFDFLVLSNTDVVIRKFNVDNFPFLDAVYGPIIKTLKRKNQNPFWVTRLKILEFFTFVGYKYNNKIILLFSIVVNKLIREFFLICFHFSRKLFRRVYSLHGSFLIFPARIIQNSKKLFNENMFLFYEELYLAYNFSMNNINLFITKEVDIIHKEDGSINLNSINEYNYLKDSFLTFYEGIKISK
jgi:hypothetical protein